MRRYRPGAQPVNRAFRSVPGQRGTADPDAEADGATGAAEEAALAEAEALGTGIPGGSFSVCAAFSM